MWNKILTSKVTLWVAIAVMILAVVGGVGTYLVLEHWLPYKNAENSMPTGEVLTIYEQSDGTLQVQWPEGINADSYTLQVLEPQTGEVLFTYTTEKDRSCLLPELPQDRELTVRITSAGFYRDKERPGETAMEVTMLLAAPRLEYVTWTVDPETDRVDIQLALEQTDTCRLYLRRQNEDAQLLETLNEDKTQLTFGKDQQYPVPGFAETYTLEFDLYRQLPGVVFYGKVSATAQLCREDFLGTVLNLNCEDLGSNAYMLTWNETKGDHYEVQQLKKEQWETVQTVARDGELTYNTGHLERFSSFSFRVIAVGGQVETPIESKEVSMTTGASTVYSTVWPLKELEIYADPERKQVLGKAPAAKAYCVLEEKDGLFGIRHEDKIGYIDSNYCMINLPEYIGDLCAYDITNSHNSIYMVHDYEIEKVTDTVITGYERVELGKDKYLVPFLYPSAKKLVQAAFAAQDQGYQLKIYDSFRPRKATTAIYDLTNKIIGDPVPEYTFEEKKDMMEAGNWPPPTEPTEATEPTDATDPTETTGATEPTEPVQTYEMLMTDNGRYALANFLALGYSNHNLGVALDLTLVNLYTGEEVEMQTAIHDLSWYSEVAKNNNDAKRLRSIMTGAGFGPLKSEWWHFQDNDAKSEFELPALQQGVTPECWMKDDTGWRYRCADGKYYTGCTKTIDGETYRFDDNGYVTET